MSVSGMLAMKEQFPHLRNGRPWRQKDVGDIETLRRLAAEGGPGNEIRRQPALRAWKAAISAVISSAARCRGRPGVVNASVTGPSVASTPVSKCSVPM